MNVSISASGNRLLREMAEAVRAIPMKWEHIQGSEHDAAWKRLYDVLIEYDSRATPAHESPNVAMQDGSVNYLCDGRRFKLRSTRDGAGFTAFPRELVGAWVALVDATDGKHLAATQGAAHAPSSIDSADVYSKSIGAAQATEQKNPWVCGHCGQVNSAWATECGRCGHCGYRASPGTPPADRSAKAVAWQCRPRGFVYWRDCTECEFRERSYCGSVPDEWEFRELYTAPPAQPASPGPLQPGASRVTDEHFIIGLRLALCQPDIDQDDIDTAREHAKLIAARAALSADHGKTGEGQ